MNAIALNQGRSLTDLRLEVVEIARRDGPRSINPDGRLRPVPEKFLRIADCPRTGERARRGASPLLRPRLVLGPDPHQGRAPADDAGYSMVDVDRILAHVAGFRGFTPSVQEAAA